ncbi:MAG: hypothetical protein CVV58_05380 [Tenericutes bacterium HGW-Tenericutes-3]|nr:MAG: hypothetical protein CVV58_05380 [Tenericutes bacterium HGW-Tenericutes-3]
MKLIEQFNHDVNQTDQSRYLRWQSYRNEITSFIHPFIKLSGKKLLVIGAGNCDDLDLSFLKKHFGPISLSDIDLLSMKEGILKQGFKENEFLLNQVDYTGFESTGFFDHLIDDFMACKSTNDIESLLSRKFSLNSSLSLNSEDEDKYDLIIILPIYTQLIYNQILNITKTLEEMSFNKNLIETIKEVSLQHMVDVIDTFNNNVLNQLKTHGLMIILSDIFQSKHQEKFHHEILHSIDRRDAMDKIYQSYLETYGYGLGDYGLYSAIEHFELIDYNWLLWPFEDELDLVVKIVCVKK